MTLRFVVLFLVSLFGAYVTELRAQAPLQNDTGTAAELAAAGAPEQDSAQQQQLRRETLEFGSRGEVSSSEQASVHDEVLLFGEFCFFGLLTCCPVFAGHNQQLN